MKIVYEIFLTMILNEKFKTPSREPKDTIILIERLEKPSSYTSVVPKMVSAAVYLTQGKFEAM